MKNILLIVLSVFIIIPLIQICFNVDLKPVEGMSDYMMENSGNVFDFSMNRVKVGAMDISYSIDDGTTMKNYTFPTDSHIYCPAGEVMCPSGTSLSGEEVFDLPGGRKGKEYNFWCADTTTGIDTSSSVQCSSDFFTVNGNPKEYRSFKDECEDNQGNPYETIFYDITSSNDSTTTNKNFPREYTRKTFIGGVELKNFTDPFEQVPFDISGKYIYIYDNSQEFMFKSSPCVIYDDISGDGCIIDQSYNASDPTCDSLPYQSISGEDPDVSGEDTGEGSSDSCDSASKCIADNGTKIGDGLCCGQTGVVKDTKYNCPADYPKCVGYKCGESWGLCQ